MNCVHVIYCVHMKVIIIRIVLKYCWYSHAHVCVNMQLQHEAKMENTVKVDMNCVNMVTCL